MEKDIKKVGLFGGSFNPIHLGHLKAAEELIELISLDKIIFIPTFIHPQRKSNNNISIEDRLRILELSIEKYPNFEISKIEIERKGPSYTVDTLREYKNKNPKIELYFILGNELFASIDTWKDYRKLFQHSNFLVITRPGEQYKRVEDVFPLELKNDFRYSFRENKCIYYEHKSSNMLIFVEIIGIKVSSTMIRELIKQHISIKNLVHEEVERFIQSNNLYMEELR